MQLHRPPILQLIIVTHTIPRHPGNRITPISHQPLHNRLPTTGPIHLECICCHRPGRPRGICPTLVRRKTIIILLHIDHHNLLQSPIHIRRIRALLLHRQRQIRNLRLLGARVPEEIRDGDVPVVRRLGADGSPVRLDGLPAGVAVVTALVHVHAHDVVGRAQEVEVYAPEGRAEGVGQPGCAFVVQRVCLAEDEWDAVVCEQRGLVELRGDAVHGAAVVHECALERDAGLGGASDVIVGGDEGDVVVCIEAVVPGYDGIEAVACTGEGGRVVGVFVWWVKRWTALT